MQGYRTGKEAKPGEHFAHGTSLGCDAATPDIASATDSRKTQAIRPHSTPRSSSELKGGAAMKRPGVCTGVIWEGDF
jgi:hypothetical protein